MPSLPYCTAHGLGVTCDTSAQKTARMSAVGRGCTHFRDYRKLVPVLVGRQRPPSSAELCSYYIRSHKLLL